MNPNPTIRLIRIGLFALPAYGLLIMVTTLRPQPDQVSDPAGWASFVSSPSYLVGHVTGNVLGTILVIFGTFALGALLTASRAPRLALAGMVLEKNGDIISTSTGVSVQGSPVNAVAWLANTLGRLGIGLKAGEVILSGSQSPLVPVKAGDNLYCSVGGLGSTSVRFI